MVYPYLLAQSDHVGCGYTVVINYVSCRKYVKTKEQAHILKYTLFISWLSNAHRYFQILISHPLVRHLMKETLVQDSHLWGKYLVTFRHTHGKAPMASLRFLNGTLTDISLHGLKLMTSLEFDEAGSQKQLQVVGGCGLDALQDIAFSCVPEHLHTFLERGTERKTTLSHS